MRQRKPNYKHDPNRVGSLKLYPKSGKALGTVSKCPKCERRGQLSLHFRWDDCDDEKPRISMTRCYRLLNWASLAVTHVGAHIGNKHEYLGTCYFPISALNELEVLLLHDRKVPVDFKRKLLVEKHGRGYDKKGVQRWRSRKVQKLRSHSYD